jgi:hypothetical protein
MQSLHWYQLIADQGNPVAIVLIATGFLLSPESRENIRLLSSVVNQLLV